MKTYIRLFLFLLSISLICQLYSCSDQGEIEDSSASSNEIPSEYLQLLKLHDGCCNKPNDSIVFIETWTWKYRNPISFFYVSNSYYLQLYKMDAVFNYSLKKAVKENFSNAHSWTYSPYVVDNRTKMEFLYKETKPLKSKNVYLDLFGDSTKVIRKNDTMVYYYSKCVNFSLKLDPQKPMDIYGESHSEKTSEIPLEIMLFKRNNKLYLLVLSAKDAAIKIKPGTLYDMLFR
ncbi:hypothetical protein [Mucilaginibacter xinganensis]|uniref:Lipoprotein n=1 Tax=Mucilaginibacter xinganensis TaxID=1234841 RepID=A0A223NXN2_9SPHI|nr:hypothetical protein [Mucilaginibacter xinganensis]ASU34623.1 hypothetical protein MuYL_2736 [Mucilaginibacter xinganensis]